jgi:hypothetical protein
MQIVFALPHRFVVIAELNFLCNESLKVSFVNRQMHSDKVIQKSEQFKEHAESVLINCCHV